MARTAAFLLLLCAGLAGADLDPAIAGELKRTLASTQEADRLAALRSLTTYGGRTALAMAQEMLRHADPATRAEAVATVCVQDRKAGLVAIAAAEADKDGRVRAAAVRALATLEGGKAIPGLMRAASDQNVQVRRALAGALTAIAPGADAAQARSLATAATVLLDDADVQVRIDALALARILPLDAGMPVLLAACRSRCEEVVSRAAEGISVLGQGEMAAKALSAQVAAAPVRERVSGLVALGVLAHPAGLPTALATLGQPDPEVRCAALEAIAACSDAVDDQARARLEAPVIGQLADREWSVRATAAQTLARIGSAKAPGLLIDLLGKTRDPDGQAALEALRSLSQRTDLVQPKQWLEWWRQAAPAFKPSRLPPPPPASSISFYDVADSFEEAVFVIDVSGSMADKGTERAYKGKEDKTKIAGARRELLQSVLALAGGTRFNVIMFSDQVRLWHEGPLRATWRAKRALARELETIQPQGATNTRAALELAFAQPDFDAIFLLTDGMPTIGIKDTAQIIKDVSAWNAARTVPIRVHAIAFFIEEAKPFLSALATANHGQYRFVD